MTRSGVTGGQLQRCRQTQSCPKIFNTNTDTEYSQALLALSITDSESTRDLRFLDHVRIYLFSGTRHGGAPRHCVPRTGSAKPAVNCQLRTSSLPFYNQRALLLALREWIP